MKKSDWELIKSIFADVVERPEDERDNFLRDRCNGNNELYDEVRSLLQAAGQSENLIESNAIDLSSKLTSSSPDYAEHRFGNYRIIKEIGAGGMGTVFLAERSDGEFSMRVALKIVRQSVADSNIISRFRQERQILADLQHPNIASLHDGGLSDKGEPFIAMEYVEGDYLTDYCRNHELAISERLRLFLRVCSAVAYAHRNLVVHRDIKPSNIIVNSAGEPILLDFGLAKMFEADASQTQTELRAFTPAYASPEQIMGSPVSTASDQYSLGVLLYELLTDLKPFDMDGKTVEQILVSLESRQTRPPSTAARSSTGSGRRSESKLSRDLDNITLKALRKEPERRYGSVEAFAEDIERYLEGRPVNARPSTFGYLASRFIRRNRAAVAAAALVIIAVFAGLAAAVWQAAIARSERDRAERRFQEVRQLSNSLIFEIAPKIERLQGSIEARELLVLRALAYLDNLAGESRDDRTLQAELALAYQKVGDLQGNPRKPNLSDFAGAIQSYEKSKAILRDLPESDANQKALASVYHELAKIRFAQGEIKRSIEESESAINAYRSLVETTSNNDPEIKRLFLASLIDQAHTYAINNQYDAAIPLYRNAVDALAALDKGDAEAQRLTAIGTAYLSNGLSWDGDQAEAEAQNEKAVALADSLRASHADDPNIQRTVYDVYILASSTFETIKNDVSLAYAEKALAVARDSVRADSADNQAKQNLAKALSRHGIILTLVGRTRQGFEQLHAAEEVIRELIDREPRNMVYQDDLGTLYTRLGDAEKSRKDLAAALAAYKRSAEIFGGMAARDEKNLVALRDWAQAIKSVGMTQIKLDQRDDARQSLRQAIDIVNRLKQQNALGKWDEKFFDEMQPLLDKLG